MLMISGATSDTSSFETRVVVDMRPDTSPTLRWLKKSTGRCKAFHIKREAADTSSFPCTLSR